MNFLKLVSLRSTPIKPIQVIELARPIKLSSLLSPYRSSGTTRVNRQVGSAQPIQVFGPTWPVLASSLPGSYGSSSTIRLSRRVNSTCLGCLVDLAYLGHQARSVHQDHRAHSTRSIRVVKPARSIRVVGPAQSYRSSGTTRPSHWADPSQPI